MISLIVATANNNIIGGNNKLLWHIPEDLKRFKAITSGNIIVMGRKTFQSLPGVLPNRKHVILTKDTNFIVDNPNVEIIHNTEELINKYKNSSVEMFIIGGGEIYSQFINSADKIYLTRVFENFEGDTYFPSIDYSKWIVESKSEIITNEKNNLKYQFINLIR